MKVESGSSEANAERGDGAASPITDVVDGPISLLAEFDSDVVTRIHGTGAHTDDGEIDLLHSYFGLDFFKHEFIVDHLFPGASQVEAEAVVLDTRTVVIGYDGGVGLLAVVDPGEPLDPVLEAVRGELVARREG